MQASITIPKLPSFVYALTGASTVIKKHIDSAIHQSISVIEISAKMVTPVKTGKLRANWQTEFSPMYGSLTPMQPYAEYVEYGTSPHTISVRNRQVLADKSLGLFFGQQVHHPGSKAQPFLQTGIDNTQDIREIIFTNEMNNALDEIAGEVK